MKKEELMDKVTAELDVLDQVRVWTKNLGKANKSFSTELRLKPDLTKQALMEVSKWLHDTVNTAMVNYMTVAKLLPKDAWEYYYLAQMNDLRELKLMRKGIKLLNAALKARPKHVIIGRIKDDSDTDAENGDAGSGKTTNGVA